MNNIVPKSLCELRAHVAKLVSNFSFECQTRAVPRCLFRRIAVCPADAAESSGCSGPKGSDSTRDRLLSNCGEPGRDCQQKQQLQECSHADGYDPVGSLQGPCGARRVSSRSALKNERILRMTALTRYFHIVAASVAASLTAIDLSICNIAETGYVRAFVVCFLYHRKSFDRGLI